MEETILQSCENTLCKLPCMYARTLTVGSFDQMSNMIKAGSRSIEVPDKLRTV